MKALVDGSTGLPQSKPEFVIKQSGKTWDLSKLDFEKLTAEFKEVNYKNIEIADLRAFIQQKLDQMTQQNATRADFAQRLQEIIDRYNSESSSADNYFDELVRFARDLKEESERYVREGLSEDELEIFDLLKKEKMTRDETQRVRLAAKSLLRRLQQSRVTVIHRPLQPLLILNHHTLRLRFMTTKPPVRFTEVNAVCFHHKAVHVTAFTARSQTVP